MAAGIARDRAAGASPAVVEAPAGGDAGAAQAGALGLRGRIVGAVLVTTVATLAVAALALLGPLEQSLRNAEKQTLRHDLQRSTMQQFKKLHLNQLPDSPADQDAYRTNLDQAQQQLSVRIGGIVNVLGYPEANGRGTPLLPDRLEGTTVDADKFDDVAKAFSHPPLGVLVRLHRRRRVRPGRDPVHLRRRCAYVLAVRKPIDEITGAVNAVRTAFITAALAGLPLTLILGIPLSARLVRRLRRLREAALELAQEGPAVEVPVDRARDEVGDLARTLATMQQRLRAAGGGPALVRGHRLARAAHAADLARRDARAARRRPALRRPRPRGRARAARPRPGPVAPARPAGRRPARPVPARRASASCARSRSSSAS